MTAYLVATDLSVQHIQWKRALYTIYFQADLETDVQEVFVVSLRLKDRVLEARDEKGKTYVVNI